MSYGLPVKTIPFPMRLDEALQRTLAEGVRRTPHQKQELIRITLRRHLKEVIEEEAETEIPKRLTTVTSWPKGALSKAYKSAGKNWDAVERAASRAQGTPSFED